MSAPLVTGTAALMLEINPRLTACQIKKCLEQSANAFLEMQQQMQKQTRNLFGNFPFPNFTGAQNPFAPPQQSGGASTPSANPTPHKDEDGGSKNGA